ncbi:hypothetical protein PVAP13_3NG140762 [Panicum virgatum]|uniref:Gnk2-homologous domain-containing protein n=1 Tax=Panicum virgatum TaxID=38727 RepID=A0A8T0U397_PANVG|nr:hypothetical protein PVAP13_3NG140762 [Panicum virgatum]
MASPALSAPLLLAFLFLVAPPGVGAFVEHVVDGDGRFLLLDCGGGGGGSGTTSDTKNDNGANLAHLFAARPHTTAHRRFPGGVCIGNDSSAADCHACLAAAARNITGVCGGPAGRRGGAWSDGSYLDDGDRGQLLVNYYYYTLPDLSYAWLGLDLARRAADEPARTLAAGEMRSPYDPGRTVRALAQCTGDRASPADCLRCLMGSAWQAALSCGDAGKGWLRGGRVLSYGCYLRFEVSYRCAGRTRPAHGEARGWADCSSAAAPAGGGASLRWLAGALVAAVMLHAPRGM